MNKIKKKIFVILIFLFLILLNNSSYGYTIENKISNCSSIVDYDEVIYQGIDYLKSQNLENKNSNKIYNKFSIYPKLAKFYSNNPKVEFASCFENTITMKFVDGKFIVLLDLLFTNNEFDQICDLNKYKTKANYYNIFSNKINKKALILNPAEYAYGNRHCRRIIDILHDRDYSISYLINEDVDLLFIKNNLQAEIIYLNTHGGFWDIDGDSQGDMVVVATGEYWTNKTEENYKFEIENQMIVEGVVGDKSFIAFTPEFIRYYYEEKEFPNSLVYMATCFACYDESMANVFLNKGANAYMGWKRDTFSWTNSKTSVRSFRLLSLGVPLKLTCLVIGYGGLINFLLRSKLSYCGNGFYRISK